jgi:ribosomal protein S18 acetylase RimI-like enzyme
VRPADPEELLHVAQLLHDFNHEFGEPAPAPSWLAERLAALTASGETEVLVTERPAAGVAVLRFRSALWSPGLECYLAELYVIPSRRGEGLGRALMERVLARARERGADHVELGTEETDVAARALYESLGFSNRQGGPDGPLSYYYEREL